MTTKAPFAMPVKQAEDLLPKSQPIAEGAAQGTVEEQRIRPLEYLDGKSDADLSKQGFTSSKVQAVSLQIGGIKALEGQDIPENKKFFTPDIILSDGGLEIDMEVPDEAWQLQRSQKAAVNLAAALGFTDIVVENGEEVFIVQPTFWELLKGEEGGLKGQQLGFVVYHRTYKTRKGEERVGEEVSTYLPAV